MTADQTLLHAAKLGVHFTVQGKAVIAIPAARVTSKLRVAIENNRYAIRAAVLAAYELIEGVRSAKEPNV